MKAGLLPTGWTWRTLADVAAPIPNAIVDGPFGSNLKLDDYRECGVPVLQGKNITNDTFRWFDIRYISDSKAAQLKRSSVRIGDILVVKIGSIGYSAYVDHLAGAEFAIIPANLAKITPNLQSIDVRYLLHWLKSDSSKRYLVGVASKTAQPALSLSKIKQMPIPVPSIDEQRRIATILDHAEALRTKRRQALAKLDSLSQALFLEMFGDVSTNSKNWPIRPLGEMFSDPPNYGTMIPPSSEGSWLSLRVGNIQDWQLDLTDRKYIDLPKSRVERFSLRDGDLLLARAIASLDHLGKCVIAHPGEENWAFDSHLMRLRLDADLMAPEYLCALLQTRGGRALFLAVTRRSAVQFNVNTKEIKRLSVPVPPIRLQLEFKSKLQRIEKAATKLAASMSNISALFISLQHRAFRGEL